MLRSIWALGLVLFLSACGGGGGDGAKPRVPTINPEPTQSLTGLTAPTFTDASIVPAIDAVLADSDSILVSDHIGRQGSDAVRFPTYCTRQVCNTDFSVFVLPYDVRDIRDAGIDRGATYTGVGEKHGVRLAQTQGPSQFAGYPTISAAYGAWMEHNVFGVFLDRITRGTFEGVNLAGIEIAASLSIGDDTGSRPAGSATWHGIMVGGTETNGSPQVIQGDATLTYDMARNDLDVAFTGIYNLDTRARFQDMRWSDLSVNSDGSFRQETASRDIEGRFYGPGHAEVGGIFVHPDALGAFGAKR